MLFTEMGTKHSFHSDHSYIANVSDTTKCNNGVVLQLIILFYGSIKLTPFFVKPLYDIARFISVQHLVSNRWIVLGF